MEFKIWGIISIIIASIIYKLSNKYFPNPHDDFGIHMLAYEVYRSKIFRYIFYILIALPVILWITGIVLGFMDAWYVGIVYIIISIILWISFSPTVR